MHIYFTAIVFLLGVVLASFFNALIYRIDKEYKYPDIFTKGSHCEKCKKQLQWYELIPIISFFIFKGKCRKCGFKIPSYYPFSELFLGIGFASTYYTNAPLYFYMLILLLFVMSYFDNVYKGVPKNIVHIFLLFALLVTGTNLLINQPLDTAILLAVVISTSIYVVGKILKKPFGLGDTLVLIGLGFLLSYTQYILFVYILLISTFISIVFLLVRGKIKMKSKIPLLPYMFTAVVLLIPLESVFSELIRGIFYI